MPSYAGVFWLLPALWLFIGVDSTFYEDAASLLHRAKTEVLRVRNWGGNVQFQAHTVLTPQDLGHLQDAIKSASQVHVLGSRHSFSTVGDSDHVLVSLEHMNHVVGLNNDKDCVIVLGGTTYQTIAAYLAPRGLALENTASLLDITVAGAVSTGTHGSGAQLQNLASQVVGIQLVTANGSLEVYDRPLDTVDSENDEFSGAVVSLGALGVITALRLKVVPYFEVDLCVYENVKLPLDNLQTAFDELVGSVYSISMFTQWNTPNPAEFTQIYMRHNLNGTHHATSEGCRDSLMGSPKLKQKVPITKIGDVGQLSDYERGPWHERIPLFKHGALPHDGNEIQSEYFVHRKHAAKAIRAVSSVGSRLQGVLKISEVRVVASDTQWLSPAFQRDSVTFHFTWSANEKAVRAVLPILESALAPFDPRPHWGKLFTMPTKKVQLHYKHKLVAIKRMLSRNDPDGVFTNQFISTYLERYNRASYKSDKTEM